MREPVWVRDDVVSAIHQRQIAEHGGADGIRDADLLESALNKPKNLFAYNKKVAAAELAASYAYGIARNHPFIDGNKRTAFVVCRLFLKLNGHDIQVSQLEKYETFMHLASGNITESKLAEWIEVYLI